MNIGLIARADATGLGIQSKEFFDHIPCKALVIDSSLLGPPLFRDILRLRPEWYPGQKIFQLQRGMSNWDIIPDAIINEFLDGLDLVVAMETPYDYKIFEMCKVRGIKTVLQFNYEFLDYPSNLPWPDLFAAPSLWCSERHPEPCVYLPVPVNTKHFKPNFIKNQFVHIAGRPAIYDRNGTDSLLRCLMYVKSEITLHIISQHPISFFKGMVPDNVQLITDFRNKEHYSENYNLGGVLVMPRKYGGLCLPVNEALAASMPVIMPNIDPNYHWLPENWLVEASHNGSFQSKRRVEKYECNPIALAAKMDEFCSDEFYSAATDRTVEIAKNISWEKWQPSYIKVFDDLINGKKYSRI